MNTSAAPSRRPPIGLDGRIDPSEPGARWFMYRRPPAPHRSSAPPLEPLDGGPLPVDAAAPKAPVRTFLPSGRPGALAIIGMLLAVFASTRIFGFEDLGVVLFPVMGIVAAVAFGNRCARLHPDEPWLPKLLLWGVIAKLVASYLRYLTLTSAYGGVGDATRYDIEGRKFVAGWLGQAQAPEITDLRQSNFIRWLTGVVYYVFGQNLLAAFLLFGLIAVVGSYLWYRAVADSLPIADKRLFLIFMMFAPSIVFWPSSLGKEALMQVGVGAMAWVTALMLNGRFPRAIPLMVGGGWLLWVVRPHLLALVAVAGAIPYFFTPVGRAARTNPFGRAVGLVAVALLVSLTVFTGAEYLGIKDLSVDSIEAQLDAQTERTSGGGSAYEHGSNSLSPLSVPQGLVTVLFRPFPWEAGSVFQLIAALETTAMAGLVLLRFDSIRLAFRSWRSHPFILYCMVLLVLYGLTISSFANFGLLSRQRSLVLPALYALLALDPARARRLEGIGRIPLRAAARRRDASARAEARTPQ